MSRTTGVVILMLIVALAGQPALVGAGSTPAPGEALLREVDRRLQPESYEAYRKLINIEPDGRRKEFVLFSVKKGRDKVLALFLEPASEKGRATLRLRDNMWLYIPKVGKPIRITSLQSVTGGIFNNSDILRVDYSVEYSVAAQSTDAGLTVLDLKAKSKTVAYDRLKMWIDPRRKLPTKIECRAATGLLIKTLHFKDVKDFGRGIVRPAVVETESRLHKGYRSVMVFGKITPRPVKDEVFTLNFLPRVDSLR